MRFRKKKTGNQQKSVEKQFIRKYLWKDPSIIEDIFPDQEWQSHEGDPTQITPSTKMAQYIRDRINKESKPLEQHSNSKIDLKRVTYYAAASVIVLLSLGIWFWIKPATYINSPNLVEQQKKTSIKEDTIWISLINNQTSIQTHTLPDRSKVRLFAQSTIRYPKHFSNQNRIIYLDGKAYFSVAKDASRPFSVYASGTKTTALGTSFTIDTRKQAKHISVTLHTGRVVVASTAQHPAFENVFLKNSGESLYFNTKMHIIAHHAGVIKQAVTAISTPDQNKTSPTLLQLNNIPLSEVFVTLNTTYNASIEIGEQDVANIQYTGSIDPQHETLQEVLTVICLINDLRYVQEPDGSYTIYRQKESITDQLINP
ncbi:FecR domain-containing protein [Sphingobacterium sp. PCS056]|uniref:FecR family protein n=1 Tax=Sphingobacterium sp. PCS056 TaxID=2931400 RepID=UPI00200DFAED|nr:FecR domain-containing protein [Sphingobacterium sp. PCS056]UPZ35116.1 FecR domain-containing protein [Sphingobacterium sp. PCS056]